MRKLIVAVSDDVLSPDNACWVSANVELQYDCLY